MGVGSSTNVVTDGTSKHTLNSLQRYVVSDEPNYEDHPDADTIIYEWRTNDMSNPLYNYDRLLRGKPTRIKITKTKDGLPKKVKYNLQGWVLKPKPFTLQTTKATPTIISKVKGVRTTVRSISRSAPSTKTRIYDPSVALVEETNVIKPPLKRRKFEDQLFPKKEIRSDDLPRMQMITKDDSGSVVEVYQMFQDPNYPEHEFGVVKGPKDVKVVENDCTRYGVTQLSGTCHAYAPINVLLLCQPLRNYVIKVMHGIMSERKDIRASVAHEYAKESLTQITASAVYRRVCETDYSIDFAPPASSGVCFTSFFLGKKSEMTGGYQGVNFIMMMSSIGLRGVVNPSRTNTLMPKDVTYILLRAEDGTPFDKFMYPGFSLIGGLCTFVDSTSAHATAAVVCKDDSLILFDSNFGGYSLNWLSSADLADHFSKTYQKRIEPHQVFTTLIFLSNTFLIENSIPVKCRDTDTFVHVKSLITVPETRRVRATYEEVVTNTFYRNKDVYTAPLYRLEQITYP